MPEHDDESGIHIPKSSAERTPANTEGCAQNQRTGARFRAAEGFFITFMLDGSRQLLRNEFQDFPVALSEAGIFVVALDYQRPNAGGAALQGNAQPVKRRGANQFHLAPAHQILKHGGRGQQWLAGSQNIFGQAVAEWLGTWSWILFIDKVRKAQ